MRHSARYAQRVGPRMELTMRFGSPPARRAIREPGGSRRSTRCPGCLRSSRRRGARSRPRGGRRGGASGVAEARGPASRRCRRGPGSMSIAGCGTEGPRRPRRAPRRWPARSRRSSGAARAALRPRSSVGRSRRSDRRGLAVAVDPTADHGDGTIGQCHEEGLGARARHRRAPRPPVGGGESTRPGLSHRPVPGSAGRSRRRRGRSSRCRSLEG